MGAQLRLVGLALTTLLIGLGCQKKVTLDNDTKKASYAIGQQIGQNIKNQGIEMDIDTFTASMASALKGEKSMMTPEEIQGAMMKMQEATFKKQMEVAEKNKKEGADFLEKNKTQPDIKTTASGLQYQVLKEGTGALPTPNDMVVAHYTGTLINGTKFDSSVDRGQPAEFPVQGVIKGWQEALQLMKVGSKWKLFVPAELAYGATPRPGIPGNSVLIFEVELLDIKANANPTPPVVDAKDAKAKKKK